MLEEKENKKKRELEEKEKRKQERADKKRIIEETAKRNKEQRAQVCSRRQQDKHQRRYLGRKRIPLQQTVVLALLALQLSMVELMIKILVMLLLKSY